MATPTKSSTPRRSKGSKHDLKIVIFPGPICFRSRLFLVSVRLFFGRLHFWALLWRFQVLKHWQIDAAWKILSNELLFISNGAQDLELWSVLCSPSIRFLHLTSETSSEHVDRCLYQAMSDSVYFFWEITVCRFLFVFATRFFWTFLIFGFSVIKTAQQLQYFEAFGV